MKLRQLLFIVVAICVHYVSDHDVGESMAIIPALIAAGAGIAGAGLSAAFSSHNASVSYRRQQELLDRQNAFTREHDLEMMRYQNAYNDPRAQAQRLMAAGYNPAFALSGVSSGQISAYGGHASSGAPGVAQASPIDFTGAASGFANVYNAYANKRLNDAQIDRSEAETRLTNETSSYYAAKSIVELMNGLKDVGLKDQEIRRFLLENKFNESTMDDRISQIRHQNDEILSRVALNKANTDVQRYNLHFLQPAQLAEIYANVDLATQKVIESRAQTAKSFSDINLNRAQIKAISAQETETVLRSYGVVLDNSQKNKLMPIIESQAREDAKIAAEQAKQSQFNTEHQEGNMWFNRVGTLVGSAGAAAGGTGVLLKAIRK